MKFSIYRASTGIFSETSPCPNAFQEREGADDYWFIEIATIEDLVAFAKTHDDIVIRHPPFPAKGTPQILIYDDYIE